MLTALMAVFTSPLRRFRAGDFDPVEERFDEGARRRSGDGRSGRRPGRRPDDAAWADDADQRGQALNRTRASGPVPFADFIRGVLAGIEHVHRVSVGAQPPVALQPRAVSDVVRLTGELVKNAMAFSPNESPVSVSGYMLDNGGLLIDITDRGVGMSADEMAQANWRLANPQSARQQPDPAGASDRTGLLLVARLAGRHGIQVRLRQAPRSGVTALVWLPGGLVVTDARQIPAGGQFPAGGQVPASGRTPARGQPQAASGPIPVQRRGGEPPRHAAPRGHAAARPEADAVARAVAAARMPRFAASQDQIPPGGPVASQYGADAASGPVSAPTWHQQQAAHGAQGAAASHPAASHPGSGSPTPPRSFSETPAGGWPRPTSGEHVRPPLAGVASMGPGQGMYSAPPASPQPASPKENSRLPIFEAVRADWFRRSKPTTSAQAGSAGTHPGGRHAVRWTSPADQDWKAAEAAHDPVAGSATQAGLPKRIPRANLIPGTAAAHMPPPQLPPRSAETLRSRLASYQRGGRAGRHAAGELRRAPPYGLPPSAGWPPTGGDPTDAGDGSGR